MNKYVKQALAICSTASLGIVLFGTTLGGWTGLGVSLGVALFLGSIAVGIVVANLKRE